MLDIKLQHVYYPLFIIYAVKISWMRIVFLHNFSELHGTITDTFLQT